MADVEAERSFKKLEVETEGRKREARKKNVIVNGIVVKDGVD